MKQIIMKPRMLFYIFILPVATAFAVNPSFHLFPTQAHNPTTSSRSTEHFTANNDNISNNIVEVTIGAGSSDQYHLIWSPKFWKKAVVSTIIYMVIQFLTRNKNNFGSVGRLSLDFGKSCHQSKVTAVVLPLLSSSCCAIQLIINALSGWGCAGFNSVLGPIRPLLLPLFILSTWNLLPQRPLGWTVLSSFLAFLPELVYTFNSLEANQWTKQKNPSNNNAVTAKLQLAIPSMGCVACVNKIDTAIRQCESTARITQEKSWLLTHGQKLTSPDEKGGMAELIISASSKEEIDNIIKNVVNAVKEAGFECRTYRVQIINNQHR
jgi:copper chaperone CopZ